MHVYISVYFFQNNSILFPCSLVIVEINKCIISCQMKELIIEFGLWGGPWIWKHCPVSGDLPRGLYDQGSSIPGVLKYVINELTWRPVIPVVSEGGGGGGGKEGLWVSIKLFIIYVEFIASNCGFLPMYSYPCGETRYF